VPERENLSSKLRCVLLKNQLEIIVKRDQDRSEIMDVGRQLKFVAQGQYDSSNHEKKLKRVRTIGYEQTDSRGSRDDFNRNFDRIFLTDKR